MTTHENNENKQTMEVILCRCKKKWANLLFWLLALFWLPINPKQFQITLNFSLSRQKQKCL